MELLNRVGVRPSICGVELAFEGVLKPSTIPDWQEFYNSEMVDVDFIKTYIGLGSVSFEEESQYSNAGISYKQTVSIRLPSADGNRSERLSLLENVIFIKLKLTTGRDIVIGRNDFKQNARLKIKIKTNQTLAEIEFQTVSIFPVGFVISNDAFGLPGLLPLTLQ